MRSETVWITRTEPGASQLAEKLQKETFQCLVEPVLTIRRLTTEIPQCNFDVVIYLSGHAVTNIPQVKYGRTATIAIGESTASMLRLMNVETLVPTVHTSEGIVDLIQRRFMAACTFLIVCGKNSRSKLSDFLRNSEKTVTATEVYDREPRGVDFKIAFSRCNIILIESLSCLDSLISACKSYGDLLETQNKMIVVPSKRIADRVKELSSWKVYISGDTSFSSTLSSLRVVTQYD